MERFQNLKFLFFMYPVWSVPYFLGGNYESLSNDSADVIPPRPSNYHCGSCTAAKLTRAPRHPQASRLEKNDRQPLDLIHSDLAGPFPVSSYGGSLNYITFVDDSTRCSWVRFLKKKSDATQTVKGFVAEIILQHGVTPKAFRTNNGGEYVSQEPATYFQESGILHELRPPYSPESLGVAERLNSTIGESLRAMLNSALTYDKRLWAEAVQTSVYLKNRQPHSALNRQPHSAVKDQTPYEAFQKPTIQHLQPFGRECYIHIPKEK
jgi:transposase InsO family protein